MLQLVQRQGNLPEGEARWYFQQLIVAVDYCHRMVKLRAVCQLHRRLVIDLGSTESWGAVLPEAVSLPPGLLQ